MANPAEKTRSSALRPIAPPPLSQHLREFASRPDAWAVLARNLIPVVGIYGFGWSAALAMFNYWFDGLTALVAIVTALIPRALRETQPKSAEAARALGHLSFDPPRVGDVHDGRPRSLLYSGATDGAAADLP